MNRSEMTSSPIDNRKIYSSDDDDEPFRPISSKGPSMQQSGKLIISSSAHNPLMFSEAKTLQCLVSMRNCSHRPLRHTSWARFHGHRILVHCYPHGSLDSPHLHHLVPSHNRIRYPMIRLPPRNLRIAADVLLIARKLEILHHWRGTPSVILLQLRSLPRPLNLMPPLLASLNLHFRHPR